MDVFQLLKEDHKKVKKLFKEYEACGDKALQKKKKISQTIFNELDVHALAEEEAFYPPVSENTDSEGEELVREAFEEHRLVKQLVHELREMDVQHEDFEAKFKVLRENVGHHIEEEEEELFPKAKEALEGEVDEVTEDLQERKRELKEDLPEVRRTQKPETHPIGQ